MVTAALLLAATFTRPLERVATMDPAMATAVYDSHAIRLVYEPPLEIDYAARPYRLVPGFCELPEVSADGLTYVFAISFRRRAEPRQSPVGAADVVRSLERLRDPELVSPNGWLLKDVDTIRALDAKTVEIRLKRRCHFFPWLMAMSPAGVRGPGGEGSGPYVLSHWRKNHEMVFERRGRGTGSGKRGFDKVRYLVVDDESTQWLMFLKGELDYLNRISRDNFDSIVGPDGRLDPFLEKQGVRIYSIPTMEVLHIGMNMKDPVLGPNRRLRQALNAAFDYPAWEKFYNGRILPCPTPVPPGVEGRLERPFPYAFDLEKAKRLIAEAGYPGGIDPKTGRRLALTMSIGRASQQSREQGELAAAFYERIGVKLEISYMTWDAFLKAVKEGRVQMFWMGWVGDYPDAQNFLQLFYSGNMSPGPNHAAYSNPEYDREYDAALASATAEERNRHWTKCQEILQEDCPWVFTHVNKAYTLVRPTVGNYIPSDFPYGHERHYERRELGTGSREERDEDVVY
ncbi:MAG: hypothetical protein IKC14_00850 [Kiritimatiellae bacterium]|nr:hypothetical protein [Kiritimatiellia bacterium]